ncbi:MAG: hypothetical protein ACOX0V_05570 [Bacteroidales bacterium]
MQSAAYAKQKTGRLNRKRVLEETIRLNGLINIFQAIKLSRFYERLNIVLGQIGRE